MTKQNLMSLLGKVVNDLGTTLNSALVFIADKLRLYKEMASVSGPSTSADNGKVLWNKTNQPVTAGRGTETVSFNGSYTGPVTILINNIKSSNVMTGGNAAELSTPSNTTTAATAGNKGTTDSVRFTAKLT